jgi:hypothetical protein
MQLVLATPVRNLNKIFWRCYHILKVHEKTLKKQCRNQDRKSHGERLNILNGFRWKQSRFFETVHVIVFIRIEMSNY